MDDDKTKTLPQKAWHLVVTQTVPAAFLIGVGFVIGVLSGVVF